MTNTKISIYNGVRDNTGKLLTTGAALDFITGTINTDGTMLKRTITALRSAKTQKEKDALKKKLHAVTWSGSFSKRKADHLTAYSALICIDIDKLDQAEHDRLKENLKADKFTWFLFTSPSGNGLKVIFKVDGGAEMHLQNFLDIEHYFKNFYNVEIDKSGKDICRLCFLSYDPEAYLNEDATTFFVVGSKKKPIPKKKPKLLPAQTPFEKIAEFTSKKIQYAPGNRNNWIFLFANNANRDGFSESETYSYIRTHYFQEDQSESEIKTTIHSAFKNTTDHAKNQNYIANRRGTGSAKAQQNKTEIDTEDEEISEDEFNEKYRFFDVRWEKKDDDESTRKVKSLKVDYLKFLSILADLGFRRIDIDKDHIWIRIENNIIEEVDDIYIQCAFKEHIEKMPYKVHYKDSPLYRKTILNFLFERQGRLFDAKILCYLPILDLDNINEDTQEEAFFYYANKCVKISKNNIQLLDYTELQNHYVWKDSILTRPINLLEFEADQDNNIWAKFLFNVCEQDNKRLQSLMHIMGYMMHKYYEGKLKAIVFTDSRISDDPQGRTGKGLIFKGLKHMLNRDTKTNAGTLCTINGKDFDPEKSQRYNMCTINTRLVHINDVKPRYDVESHYNEIEEGIMVDKKYMQPFNIKVKIGISTNRTLKINGDSSLDRFIVFDLSAHYNKANTPDKEFGKWFFRDFTEHEWNLFDTFMIYCVQFYLQNGFMNYKSINLEKRILHEQVGEELINFLSDFPNAGLEDEWSGDFGIIPTREYVKKDLYQMFITNTGLDPKRYKQRWFTNKLRQYKNYDERWENDYQDKEGNHSQERRTNGKDIIWFTEVTKKETE